MLGTPTVAQLHTYWQLRIVIKEHYAVEWTYIPVAQLHTYWQLRIVIKEHYAVEWAYRPVSLTSALVGGEWFFMVTKYLYISNV
jgi:hypothetical protein